MKQPDVTTASTGVQSTYYGMPVIKAPHWRWLVINYFFLGGLAAGGFIISSLAELMHGDRALIRAGRYISFAGIAPTPLLLILDLGRPERALHMLRILKLRSPMSIGSWAIAFLGIFFTLSAALQLVSDVFGRKASVRLQRAVSILGLPFAALVSGYTGVLLEATNIPLWARFSPLLGPTFAASSLSTSFAATSLLLGFGKGEREGAAKRVARAEAVCLATELSLLTAAILRLGRLGRPLTAGRWGRIFWPVTYAGGLVIPLGLQLSGPVRGKRGSRPRRTVTALLVLAGGYMLRTLIIFAGRESANRPEDYFELTRSQR